MKRKKKVGRGESLGNAGNLKLKGGGRKRRVTDQVGCLEP